MFSAERQIAAEAYTVQLKPLRQRVPKDLRRIPTQATSTLTLVCDAECFNLPCSGGLQLVSINNPATTQIVVI